jgi:putative Holliday junction resolvase
MRFLGIDVGRRRIGVAISDGTGTLARPLTTIQAAGSLERTVGTIVELAHRLSLEEEGLAAIVVGLPKHLDGSSSEQTGLVTAFAAALGAAVALPIRLQDERLTSHEADSRLAETDRNWRTRKTRLDAAAAAIILQDYLDEQRDGATPGEDTDGRGNGSRRRCDG